MFHFFIEKDGETLGPYSAKDMQKMQLSDDVWVTEDSLNGEWRMASEFDFDELVGMEFADYDESEYETEMFVANDSNQQRPGGEVTEEKDIPEEGLQEWRTKRRERIAKEERRSNRFGGLLLMVVGLVVGGVGVLISVLLEDRIMIGLILIGVFLFLGGTFSLVTGKEMEMDD